MYIAFRAVAFMVKEVELWYMKLLRKYGIVILWDYTVITNYALHTIPTTSVNKRKISQLSSNLKLVYDRTLWCKQKGQLREREQVLSNHIPEKVWGP